MNRKSNVWIVEFIVVLVFFSVMFVFFITSGKGLLEKAFSTTQKLTNDAEALAESLLSTGVPAQWDAAAADGSSPWDVTSDQQTRKSISSLGVMDEGGVNISVLKLLRFGGWTETYYEETKAKLGVRGNYLIFFEDHQEQLVDFDTASSTQGIFYGDRRLGSHTSTTYVYEEGFGLDANGKPKLDSIPTLSDIFSTNNVKDIYMWE